MTILTEARAHIYRSIKVYTGKTLTGWSESRGGHQVDERDGAPLL